MKEGFFSITKWIGFVLRSGMPFYLHCEQFYKSKYLGYQGYMMYLESNLIAKFGALISQREVYLIGKQLLSGPGDLCPA